MLKEFSVYFKIISINIKNRTTINLIYISFVITFFIPLIFYIFSSFYKGLEKWANYSIYIPLIGLLVLLILNFTYIKKNYKINEIGILIFTRNSIIIKIKGQKITFNITELSNLALQYNGYQYQPKFFLPSSPFKSGNENYIKFVYNGEEKLYQFKSETPNDYKYIKKLLSLWKENGVKYEYVKT